MSLIHTSYHMEAFVSNNCVVAKGTASLAGSIPRVRAPIATYTHTLNRRTHTYQHAIAVDQRLQYLRFIECNIYIRYSNVARECVKQRSPREYINAYCER